MSAPDATGAGQAGREDTAFAVAAAFPLDDRRRFRPIAIVQKRQPGGKMRLHGAIEGRALGLARAVDGTA